MAESTFWWVLTGCAVALELITGTFYLLMLGLGLVAAAVAAHLGASIIVQIVVAAVVGAGAVVIWHTVKQKQPAALPASVNPDVNMDVGELVQVDAWQADGTAFVKYRGAQWTVINRPGNNPAPGPHRVAEVIGNRLVVDRA